MEITALAKALKMLREQSGLSQQAAADQAGITRQAWQNYETGARQSILRSDKQDELARALGFSRETLLLQKTRGVSAAQGAPPAFGMTDRSWASAADIVLLPIRDEVRAGAWLAVDAMDQTPPRLSATARDARYPNAEQWLAPVVGDSMNERGILNGDLVHIVDAHDIAYYPRNGDIVEVERVRFQGRERELTLKEIEVAPEGLLLWPRSSNPMWREPIRLADGMAEGDDGEIRIRGLMLQLIRRF
ncbi:MAG: helix-turn-helix domain-containing protein [Caulobacter sp.]